MGAICVPSVGTVTPAFFYYSQLSLRSASSLFRPRRVALRPAGFFYVGSKIMVDREAVWNFDAQRSVARSENESVWIDLPRRSVDWSHDGGTGQVLQLICSDECQPRLEEHFARGAEYVARYTGIPVPQSSAELRWCFQSAGAGTWQIDWLASVQTDQAASSVHFTCRSQWNRPPIFVRTAARGWFAIDEQLFTLDRSDHAQAIAVPLRQDRTYAEFIWPQDYDGLHIGRGMEYTVAAWRLAACRLERGVIRRFRIRAIRDNQRLDPEWLDAAYRDFVSSPVPLTA